MRIAAIVSCLLVVTACSGSDPGPLDDTAADEPPFFVADPSATGPLTLAELQIHIPADVDKWLTDRGRACFLQAVERRANEAGDPAELDPDDFPYWGGNVNADEWSRHDRYLQRVLLAQAIVSWAMMDC